MTRRLKKRMVLALIALFSVLSVIALWGTIFPPDILEGPVTYFGHDSGMDPRFADSLTLTLLNLDEGRLAVSLDYDIGHKDLIEKLKNADHLFVNIHNRFRVFDIGTLVSTNLSNRDSPPDVLHYASERGIPIDAESASPRHDFYFPFDAYCTSVTPNVELYPMNGSGTIRESPDVLVIHVELPGTFQVRSTKYVEVTSTDSNSPCAYLKDDDQSDRSWTDRRQAGFAVYIDHPWWYRALILLLVSALIVPTILITRAALDSIATDLLAGLITIISVRGMIFGPELTIHLLDIVIGAFFMAFMIIPLVKWAKE